MSEQARSLLFQQLGFNAPPMLVYVIGIVLAIVYFRRATTPAILALVGIGIMGVATVGLMLGQAVVISIEHRDPNDVKRISQMLAMGASVLRAAGLGVLIAAVFAGRGASAAGRDFRSPI